MARQRAGVPIRHRRRRQDLFQGRKRHGQSAEDKGEAEKLRPQKEGARRHPGGRRRKRHQRDRHELRGKIQHRSPRGERFARRGRARIQASQKQRSDFCNRITG